MDIPYTYTFGDILLKAFRDILLKRRMAPILVKLAHHAVNPDATTKPGRNRYVKTSRKVLLLGNAQTILHALMLGSGHNSSPTVAEPEETIALAPCQSLERSSNFV